MRNSFMRNKAYNKIFIEKIKNRHQIKKIRGKKQRNLHGHDWHWHKCWSAASRSSSQTSCNSLQLRQLFKTFFNRLYSKYEYLSFSPSSFSRNSLNVSPNFMSPITIHQPNSNFRNLGLRKIDRISKKKREKKNSESHLKTQKIQRSVGEFRLALH